jgi:hypothetical protein
MCNPVGIDHYCSELAQNVRDFRFSRSNAAGQADH